MPDIHTLTDNNFFASLSIFLYRTLTDCTQKVPLIELKSPTRNYGEIFVAIIHEFGCPEAGSNLTQDFPLLKLSEG